MCSYEGYKGEVALLGIAIQPEFFQGVFPKIILQV